MQGWSSGADYRNISGGGPSGTDDKYLQLERPTPTAPYPFHIGAKNTTTWTGDYLTAGVKAIEMDIKAFSITFGPANLSLRVVLFGPGGAFSTKDPITIITNGDWQHVEFGLTRSDLVRVSGYGSIYFDPGPEIDNLTETLSNVETLLIRHDSAPEPTPIGLHPEHISATIGIDNISAVLGPTPTYDIAWTFGNVVNQSYILNSFEPYDILLGDFEIENPTLLLHWGKRYQITVIDDVNQPFEIIAKGTNSEQDDILLSTTPDTVGLFESDPDVAWDDNGLGTVTFTLTEDLYNAMTSPDKRPGYRCGVYIDNMRGNFDVCTSSIAGDLNGDCIVDFSDFELFILNWMKENIVP